MHVPPMRSLRNTRSSPGVASTSSAFTWYVQKPYFSLSFTLVRPGFSPFQENDVPAEFDLKLMAGIALALGILNGHLEVPSVRFGGLIALSP